MRIDLAQNATRANGCANGAAEALHQGIMTATNEECNDQGRSQTQGERGPDLYPVPNVPNEVGAHIAALSF
jgi:hypothetical protein